ncbi:putative MFS family arabinose efflux permease [Kushneria sinocarnis]|uniref:Putative MFS family arabinose efflux permease n=2 Tax=Kushneria sinocarnis TaxID=595502 RepID=A0A420WV59_9GAMM|nr:putative MFS family arabinose efflux permease [Kushneria sinocarnis]
MSRGWLAITLAFLVTMVGTTLPTPLYPIYQQRYGFSEVMITVIFATYALGVMAALIVTGRWSDRLGRRPVLLAGLGVALLSSLCFLVAQGLGLLLVGRLLSGISAGIFTGTATVAVIEAIPERWQRHATLIATAANMGGLGLGPLLAGVVGEYLPWSLRLCYGLHLVLTGLAMVAVMRAPETVTRPADISLRPQRLALPEEVRSVFVPAAIAGFAGFNVLGLFTASAPAFVGGVLDIHNGAVIGGVVLLLFIGSIAGQALQTRYPRRIELASGCRVLAVGAALVGASIMLASMALLVIGALVAGAGQGIVFRAGMGSVSAASPAAQRASVASTLFVVFYVAISLPIVGIGLVTMLAGIRIAATLFAAIVVLLTLVALAMLKRHRGREAAS